MVCDDASQSVYLTDGQKVTDVYVEQGQQVKEGDKLMTYDVTSLSAFYRDETVRNTKLRKSAFNRKRKA